MNSNRFFLIALVIVFIGNSRASEAQVLVKQYVKEHAVKMPDDPNYLDLRAIGTAVGDATVVMLGEQDHGDAATFLVKTKLIKYLHEKKGFNVLAFEGDFFGLNYNWSLVQNKTLTIDSFINKNVSPMWTQCTACQDLFRHYLPATLNTEKPIEITGFDDHLSTKVLIPILDSIFRSCKMPITASEDYGSKIIPLISEWYKNTSDSTTNQKIRNYLTQIRNELSGKLPVNDFWLIVLDNFIQENLEFNNWKKDYWKDMNTRDYQMALNLRWLCQVKFQNQKVIVWAHNYHISKNSGDFPEEFMNNSVTMGSVVAKDSNFSRKTYSIGFTSAGGVAGRLFQTQYKVPRPGSNSFENWIDNTCNYAFVDFKTFNEHNPAYSDMFFMSGSIKGNMLHTNHLAQWNKVFDGVYFIRDMYPCQQGQ